MVYLRIIFTVISALCIAALVPLGMTLGWRWVGYCFFGALLSFAGMIFCKQSQELKELKKSNEEQAPTGDFFSTPTEKREDTKEQGETLEKENLRQD